MKKHFYLFLFFLFFSVQTANATDACLYVLDAVNATQLPKKFRTTSEIKCQMPSGVGLANLNISGSAQFSAAELKKMIQVLPDHYHMIDVDLREESHGFLNGYAVSCWGVNNFGNLGKSEALIQADETDFLNALGRQKKVKLGILKKADNGVQKQLSFNVVLAGSVSTEEKLVKSYAIDYQRIYVTDRHRPTDQQVDQFIAFFKTLTPRTWLHFHCRAGKGRTTTFMAMYDMMRNAKRISFDDILIRQAALGGVDLRKLPPASDPFYFYALARFEFLKNFYLYCRENKDNFSTSWSQWLGVRKI